MATEEVGIMATGGQKEDIEFLWKWRKHMLLLATLVASVTYVAGLNPPGGVRSEDGREHRVSVDPPLASHRVLVDPPLPPAVYPDRVGDPVLASTYSRRYAAFFYCNTAAFDASLVVIIFMLDRRIINNYAGLAVLRCVMLLDLLALMAAFAAGSCGDVVASIYVSTLFVSIFAYVAVRVLVARASRLSTKPLESHLKEGRNFIFQLATFATPLTYGAGLAPPGGFWSKTGVNHRAGSPLLHDGQYKIRYQAFFYANANSFVASLAIIMLLMSRSLSSQLARSYVLPVFVLVELLGLMAAFAAGSCRWITTTVYIISLLGAVAIYILLQVFIAVFSMDMFKQWRAAVSRVLKCANLPDTEVNQATPPEPGNDVAADQAEESHALLLLLASLAATVTYQAGLSPPGGVWSEGHPHHIPGNPVLLDMNPSRYKAFYHCNTAAFVASLVVIIIIQSTKVSSGPVMTRVAIKTAMILGLLGLMGAYVAGSCRDITTTIYVLLLAVAVLVYSIAKVVAYTAYGQSRLVKWVQRVGTELARTLLRLPHDDQPKSLERKRKFLLYLAILAATLTYQTGLNPPGGFSPASNEDKKLTAGDPILLDGYRTRYQVFFYCNATGFMASVAVIMLLVNQTLYRQSIRSKAVHVCIVVGLVGLMGAYAAGSCRQLRTSIYVFSLVVAVVTFLILHLVLYVLAQYAHWSELPWLPTCLKLLLMPLTSGPAPAGENKSMEVYGEETNKYLRRKDVLVLLAMLGASVTYQAGLVPPGGTLGDEDTISSPLPSPSPLVVAGDPILRYSNLSRYQAFFYCNATSFVASIVVILLLLLRTMKRSGAPLWAMQTAVLLDQLGMLGAYAAGSWTDWETAAYVIALVAVVAIFITLHVPSSFDAVLNRARKLPAWRYFGGANDNQIPSNDANV